MPSSAHRQGASPGSQQARRPGAAAAATAMAAPGSGAHAAQAMAAAIAQVEAEGSATDTFRFVLSDEDARRLPLNVAARARQVARLIAGGADLEAREPTGITPLRAAAMHGLASIASQLLAAGAYPDAADDRGVTQLISASQAGHTNVVQQLLAAGAAVNRTDMVLNTPLHLAAEKDAGKCCGCCWQQVPIMVAQRQQCR